ncbi:protein of unknown function DUF2263 [Penicillium italicum]|uniref:Microbial-type PARG catalytic domain-containing protein n=1 Tax=Penicillium italicum TaxID=40296 RepID=A0A0A2LH73_PENIT|nr:protein of unknown function DUF2263 [Penicillium italicum]
MPKKKLPAQSDISNTSGSTQSKQSIGSQYANKSPAPSRNSRFSSSGLTGLIGSMIGKLPSGSSSPKDAYMTGLDGQSESPDLLSPPESVSGLSLTPARKPNVLKKRHPAQKPGLAKKRRPSVREGKGKGVNKPQLMAMKKVISTTKQATIEILSRSELEGTRFGYIVNKWTAPVLDPNSNEYPNLTTVVRVLQGDTYDRALEMHDTGSTSDRMPVCVLNFANAYRPGGGWLNGARAQEEQLCYRSTLIDTLQTRFYPMGDLEGLYSPNVIVFRKSVENEYSFMSAEDELHLNPTVSVISMAARSQPKLTADGSTYVDSAQRYLMIAKMQLILRTAAHNNHRRLVLGALGCGAFSHPTEEVADCWYKVLMKKEFKGWFERINFVIRDSPSENNLKIFREALDGLSM